MTAFVRPARNPSLTDFARALGGEVTGGQVLAPGPGHSPQDRSLAVRIDPQAPDGFVVHSFAGDDWQAVKDYLRERIGRPAVGSQDRRTITARSEIVREYVYRDATGAPYLKVARTRGKDFLQSRWEAGAWRSGAPKGPRIPYRLPDLIAAPEASVWIVEGEKDADNLAALGLVATTNPMGAGKWIPQNKPDDLSGWFRGRDVVILPDNDHVGRQHARHVASHLITLARSVRILALPGLPEKGDVSDWLASGGDRATLEDMAGKARPVTVTELVETPARDTGTSERRSRFYSAAELDGRSVPPREWLVDGLVPSRTVTLFGGDGGTGKSLLALQLAVAVAGNTSWIGRAVTQGRAIFLSAEDDDDELHRRLDDILRAEGRSYDALAGLTLRSLAGEDALLAIEGQMKLLETALFAELEARAEADSPALIVIDTLADVYPSNENDRAKVRQFIGILRGLAIKRRCAVVLLAHPSLTGLSNGTGLSGSTAWNNSVRSRLYLKRITDDGYEPDPDARILSTMKANYGRTGDELHLTWDAGRFAPKFALDEMAPDLGSTAKAERVFLKLLATFTEQGRRVSAQPSNTYAPSMFAKHPDAEGMTKRALVTAMERLLSADIITQAEHGRGASTRRHLVLAEGRTR